ncbi:MAG TPA: hypothetical protein VFL13_06845 [Candidatus Baltobacteraceae bacterium]|nr:hypothetical protein [Candidatus Baltobacteraceae bacterium]
MPTLIIEQPPDGTAEPLHRPFNVNGQATDVGMPEPHIIQSVTVKVDDGPEIRARLKRVIDRSVSRYSFSASTQIEGSGPHTVSVTATNDDGITVTRAVTVFGQQVSDAPAILMDVLLPSAPDPSVFQSLIVQLQQYLLPLSSTLASINKKLIGPNTIVAPATGAVLVRFGLWIEDSSFPSLPPDGTFPMPRLSDAQTADGFAQAPPLPQQDSTFAFSIATAALQSFVDAAGALPSGTGYSVDSISVRTSAPSQVITTAAGTAGGAGFTAEITETLSLKPQADGTVVPSIDSSYSTSVGSTIDWFIPVLNIYLLAIWGLLSHETGGAVDQATGAARAVLKTIPRRIPFRNNVLSGLPDFPVVDIRWERLGTTASSIEGAGYATVEARDQSTVALTLDGTSEIVEPQEEVIGGAHEGYDYVLVDITPDSDKFAWTVTGTGNRSRGIDRSPFTQSDVVSADFPLPTVAVPGTRPPRKTVEPGNYPFTLTVNATETCASDSSKMLQASNALDVRVQVKANPPVPR